MRRRELLPGEIPHPGFLIRDEIERLGWTQKELASKMDVAPNILSELMSGKRYVTPIIALKLEKNLKIEAEQWLQLQITYDLDVLRKRYKEEFGREEI
ncbi:MAG: HigA family addiction module antidote protein [Candidatus Symbiothrix sp.]|jgi:HTH-type transcriptional regulator/antitoxin HigA|nr:HigA family addiction module antidote protein [Candidatus Symbiothrix sp.]